MGEQFYGLPVAGQDGTQLSGERRGREDRPRPRRQCAYCYINRLANRSRDPRCCEVRPQEMLRPAHREGCDQRLRERDQAQAAVVEPSGGQRGGGGQIRISVTSCSRVARCANGAMRAVVVS